MNLFLLLGQLDLSHEHHEELLIPIGTVYDPFVLRGLDALIYSLYSGSKFITIGTPSGITLAPEGGAHQSTITPSVMMELPGVVAYEPGYATALDWILCDGISQLSGSDGTSLYCRLSTRAIDQEPFDIARENQGEEALRESVLAGAYRLREPGDGEPIVICASGPVMPEVLEAASILESEGFGATVIDVTSLDRLNSERTNHIVEAARCAAERTTWIILLGSYLRPREMHRWSPSMTRRHTRWPGLARCMGRERFQSVSMISGNPEP